MLKVLKSFFVIAAALAVAGGATYAVFTAQDSITGNTISTASVTIDAKGEANATTLAKPVSATGLVPGEFTPWARGAIHNQSTENMKFFMYVDNLQGAACPVTNLTITTGHAGSDAGERARVIKNNVVLTSIAGAANKFEITGVPPFTTAGPNITQVIQQRAQLDPSAAGQGQTCTWDEIFIGEAVPAV